MSKLRDIFTTMPERYIPGKLSETLIYYFSVGPEKWTITLHPDKCTAVEGKPENADVILKAEPKLFENMVLKGKMPGPIDIARGKLKTNNPAALQNLRDLFRTS